MSLKDLDVLRDAVDRNLAAVISLPSAGMLRHGKSRLLGSFEGNIVMEMVPGEKLLIGELISTGERCGISLRSGQTKLIFASKVIQMMDAFRVSAELSVAALVVEFPAEVKAVQRRTNYRVHVPEEFGLALRVWRIPEQAYLKQQPSSHVLVQGQIRDISIGGMGVKFTGKDGEAPKITTEDRLRMEIKTADTTLIIEGRMRKPTRIEDDYFISGVTFKKMEDNIEGRQNLAILTKIVGELQRDELRRARLGATKAG